MLSKRLVQFAQFLPKEQGQNRVWAESEIGSSQSFVESRHALLLQSFGKTVSESFIEQPLQHKTIKDPP